MRSPPLLLAACLGLSALLAAPPVAADPICRAVELHFAPGAPNLQIAAWIEDAHGNYIDTAYITRLTGQFGLGNRPGTPLLKTDFGWPYGRREMVLPVWAHRRNHHYPKVVMGGACGNSPMAHCPDGSLCMGDCEDSTIAYHSKVSSYEPFYCSPSGASGIDALSCASKGTFSKGAYADAPAFSLYPPRADLMAFTAATDSPDTKDFASRNDLIAISRATPIDGKPLDPAVTWFPAQGVGDGDYVAFIELSEEADWNQGPKHQNQPDSVQLWDFEGKQFLGQPSVVYQVPFHLGPNGDLRDTDSYSGYGSWDGSNGALNPPDNTISDQPKTGAGRLLDIKDGQNTFRFRVVVGGCGGPMVDGGSDDAVGPRSIADGAASDGGAAVGDGGASAPDLSATVSTKDAGVCDALPDPVTNLQLTGTATEITVAFTTPAGGFPPARYAVRYREGDLPITDAEFDFALSAPDPPTPPGPATVGNTEIHGLMSLTTYTVAVRSISPCNKGSHVVSATLNTPAQQFAILHGCFVATAAYGSPLAAKVETLRRFRDQRLLDNPTGRLFVAAYYALSPSLANAIGSDRRLRALTRAALAPLVSAIERR